MPALGPFITRAEDVQSLLRAERARRTSELLRTFVLEGQHEESLGLHQTLPSPTPEDDYWAALSHLALNHSREAIVLLERAMGSGYQKAIPALAYLTQQHGERERAKQLLGLLESGQPWDEVFVHAAHAQLFEAAGQYSQARRAYETAWTAMENIQADPVQREHGVYKQHGHVLFVQLGYAFASLLERIGFSEAAWSVLQAAKRGRGQTLITEQLLYLEAITAAQLERWGEARAKISALTMETSSPEATALACYAAGTLARLEGRWQRAIKHFEYACLSAHNDELLFGAHLLAADCALALADPGQASTFLGRARAQLSAMEPFLSPASARINRARLLFTQGVLEAQLNLATCLEHFEMAREEFAQLELKLEQSLVLLHIANLHARAGDLDKSLAALRKANTLRKTIENQMGYRSEMAKLPCLAALLDHLEG